MEKPKSKMYLVSGDSIYCGDYVIVGELLTPPHEQQEYVYKDIETKKIVHTGDKIIRIRKSKIHGLDSFLYLSNKKLVYVMMSA